MSIKNAWHHETLVQNDSVVLLAVLYGEGVDYQRYLSVEVEDELYLVIPISDDQLSEFNFWADPDQLRPLYEKATEFYTGAYEGFDGDLFLLKPIERKDINPEWWPGEEQEGGGG